MNHQSCHLFLVDLVNICVMLAAAAKSPKIPPSLMDIKSYYRHPFELLAKCQGYGQTVLLLRK